MKFSRQLRALFRREKLETEMAEEMRAHVDLQTDRNIAAGMTSEEARYAALRQFGNMASIQEQVREQRGWAWLEGWLRDLRLALRTVPRFPGFSLAVVITLTLCIGPNAAVLSALQELVLKALPFADPQQLVVVRNVGAKTGNLPLGAGLPQQLDYAAHAGDHFAGFALFEAANTTIGEDSVPVRASGYRVTANLFDLLGLTPLTGRFFRPEEETDGRDHVLVLSHAFWVRQYQADPQAVGRTVRMGGEMYTIVGVAPPRLEGAFARVDFFWPYRHGADELLPLRRFTGARTTLIGRLRPGVSLPAAQARLEALEQRFRTEQASPGMREAMEKAGIRLELEAWHNPLLDQARGPLWMLSAGAALVLLIGCVNVANLALARASARRGEFAIRLSLGASWGALCRQLFCEVLVLAAAALAAGIAGGWATLHLINRSQVVIERWIPTVRLDLSVIVLILFVGMFIALAVGLMPLWLLRREGLRLGDNRTASASGGMRAMSSTLVVGQVALALVLLIGAGLMVRSFAKVMAVDPGFDASVVQGRVAVSRDYEAPEANMALRRRVLEAVREIPGVRQAGVSSYFGVGPASSFRAIPYTLHRVPPTTEEAKPTAYINPVSPGFFAAMGMRLIEGRDFVDSDQANNRFAGVIVDRTFAQRHFPGRSALGEEVSPGTGPYPPNYIWPRIVGVVDRANIVGLEERDGIPVLYTPLVQGYTPGFNVVVNSNRAPADVLADVREKLRQIDSTLPFYNTGTLRETLDLMLLPRRALVVLLIVFSGLALLLAAVGLYGVLAYDVAQRTKEIGIRGAIGASREQILRLILAQGMRKMAWGTVIGLAGAFYLTQFLRKLLFDVRGTDPLTYVGVTLLLAGVALLACWLPARRATKVDPVVALRAE